MNKWTFEQEAAINLKDTNLLVAAAAGSGKTAVLVERIIKKICNPLNPIDIDKLLVVTFTNAAAAEMKEKIGVALSKAIKNNPNSKALYRQLTLLNNASIMTLHSFCLEIVRENFYKVDLDPNFRIADDMESELLRLEALEELLEEYYQKSDPDDLFLKFMDAYGGEKDDSLAQELILKLFSFSRSNPFPKEWLEKIINNYDEYEWFKYLLDLISSELEESKNLLNKALNICNHPKGPKAYLKNIEDDLSIVNDLLGASTSSFDNLSLSFNEVKFKRMASIKKTDDVDENLKNNVKDIRDKVKDKINKIQSKYFFRSEKDYLEDIKLIKPYMNVLKKLVLDFSEAYLEKKIKRNILDFNDLEHFCLQILLNPESNLSNIIPSEISLKLKEKFQEILVDEYQDINEVQETILKLLAKENNLFMVGDVKQSIYRFRLASPELFLTKYQRYPTEEGSKKRRIDLSKNFRCRKEIVNGVNYIFKEIMNSEFGEIKYDEKAKLVYGADYKEFNPEISLESPIEVHLLEKKIDDELTYLDREANLIGEKIKRLIDKEVQVYDKELKDYRILSYRDIVILFRSPKGSIEPYVEEFRKLGIPVYADLGSGFFEATEIQVMLSLLKIIDNPYQDIPLVSVLRSPIVGLDAYELSKIGLNNNDNNFYEALKITLETDDSELGEKLKEFIKNLNEFREIAGQGNIADLIWSLYRKTKYFDYVGAMPTGIQRQANLRALHERAKQYEATSFRGLFMFLRFIERLRENKGDLETAKALSENENVVRIMSIHKSKGLEFPVVFIAGLGKNFNLMDLKQDIIFDKEIGMGPLLINSEKRIKYPTVARLVIENKLKIETLSEEMRILYVALTRAREKLILVGSANGLAKRINEWNILSKEKNNILLSAKNYLDWLGPALIKHKDGEVLRNIINSEEDIIDDRSKWDIITYKEEYFKNQAEISETNEKILNQINNLEPIEVDFKYQQEVEKRLTWQYPYHDIVGKGAKLSVTEIKHYFQEKMIKEDFNLNLNFNKRPNFIKEKKGLSAMEKGSAIHLVMQHINLNKEINLNYLNELLPELVSKEILTEEQSKIVDLKLVLNFFQTPIGKRMKNFSDVKKELPFSLSIPLNEFYETLALEDEKILVQGIIDCLWMEDDGFILLDYKSDYVNDKNIKEIVNRYEGQINLYTRAVETIYKKSVKERYLYLFNIGKAVKI